MIWLSSFTSSSRLGTNKNNYSSNVRNTLTETIGMVLSMVLNDIISPRFLTMEPSKQKIAGWRINNMEATLIEVNQMKHAATNITREISTSGLQTSRRKQNVYNRTLESLLDSASSLPQESSSGPVDLAYV